MKAFADLYYALDATTKTNEKVAILTEYFRTAHHDDAAWALYFLCGNRLGRLVSHRDLRQWAADYSGIPDWLLEESYQSVGDLAETISLLVPPGEYGQNDSLDDWVRNRLIPMREMSDDDKRRSLTGLWDNTDLRSRFVTMKLITGGFRVGVSKRLVTRALAEASGIPVDVMAHRLIGQWKPSAEAFAELIDPDAKQDAPGRPYPFCLAHPLHDHPSGESLGAVDQFLAEWKWDGIRGQLIRRNGQTFLWSRGEELMEDRWPEIEHDAATFPEGTVLDGEILACDPDRGVLPFAQLQRRIGRKRVGKKLMSEVPVVFYAFDLLEIGGEDIRQMPLQRRRQEMERLFASHAMPSIRINATIPASDWDDWAEIRQQSRQNNAEGLMLKRLDGRYDVGRVKGTWWKWKVEPYTIDAVLIYAQKGHGRRSGLYTDYTFALWDEGELVPFAKAYSGLDDTEIRKVDQFVRRNTSESFGPVRRVAPTLVMELAFEGLQRSNRHKSGVATRFPRIVRWRHDKKPQQANRLSDLLELLPDG